MELIRVAQAQQRTCLGQPFERFTERGGPHTMEQNGPVTVLRWGGGFASDEQNVVFADQLEKVLEVPFGQGNDHAEGMCLFKSGGQPGEVLMTRLRLRGAES
ncbi:DUF3616 domain-containing protein [Pseudomonas sp. V98_8]|uniref:DUF3616 domain-containing protein n=1 Tax=Pseudomonas sp. V98_8 TaxID=3044228 RepID=UPI0032B86DC4